MNVILKVTAIVLVLVGIFIPIGKFINGKKITRSTVLFLFW